MLVKVLKLTRDQGTILNTYKQTPSIDRNLNMRKAELSKLPGF